MIVRSLSLLHFLLLTACASAIPELYPPTSPDQTAYISIVRHQWHTGVVLPKEQLGEQLSHIGKLFPKADFVEIGWGEADFYQADDPGVGTALGALFWANGSVLHVVGFNDEPHINFPRSSVYIFGISHQGLENLRDFIKGTLHFNADGSVTQFGNGLYGDSHFLKATHSYHLFNTCNHWTADAIRSTGFPITPFYAFTAGNVEYQLLQDPYVKSWQREE